MAQLTIRASDALVHRLRAAAAAHGTSMNDYVSRVLDAATDPDLAGTEVERIRERLAAAGLLEEPYGDRIIRPPADQVAAARVAAAGGRPLAAIVSSDRG